MIEHKVAPRAQITVRRRQRRVPGGFVLAVAVITYLSRDQPSLRQDRIETYDMVLGYVEPVLEVDI